MEILQGAKLSAPSCPMLCAHFVALSILLVNNLVCAHVCCGGRRGMLGIVPYALFSFFYEVRSLSDLLLIKWARLTGHRALVGLPICVCLPSTLITNAIQTTVSIGKGFSYNIIGVQAGSGQRPR